jgi:hypothetical protein
MLSWMATDFFAHSPVLAYPVAALGIFMLVFVGIGVRTLLAPKERIDALARLPRDRQEQSHG